MEKLIVASVGKNAGKTSLIIGLGKVFKKPFGYLKPFGDRMIYREKKAWDYDADLVMKVFGMKEDPEDMTLGFEHSKLRYMYDAEGRKKRLSEMVSRTGKELLLIEGGMGLGYGVSIGLDPVSLARDVGGTLVIVIDGHEDTIVDGAIFLKHYLDRMEAPLKGVIFNKVQNVDDFKNVHLAKLGTQGIPVLGVVPFERSLTLLTVKYLADRLFAKVITGEEALNRVIRNILVGAMTINALFHTSLFQKQDKLVITSGDRADMILAAIESDAACIVITNNILPTSNIISKAYERKIPMLLVPQDTYQVATRIDNIETLLSKEDSQKINIVEELVQKYVDWKKIIGTP